MDTILPIASSTWTFSTLNMDKMFDCATKKKSEENHSTEHTAEKTMPYYLI
jgi:hypothetical protein